MDSVSRSFHGRCRGRFDDPLADRNVAVAKLPLMARQTVSATASGGPLTTMTVAVASLLGSGETGRKCSIVSSLLMNGRTFCTVARHTYCVKCAQQPASGGNTLPSTQPLIGMHRTGDQTG